MTRRLRQFAGDVGIWVLLALVGAMSWLPCHAGVWAR